MTPQQQIDLVIVVVYLIAVAFVLYQAFLSLEDQVSIQMDSESFKAQLEEKNLQGLINVKVKLKDFYRFEQLYDLSLSVSNGFSHSPVYVDWDYSSLTDFVGRSRRVIRLTPTMTVDLSQPQIFSVIAPGKVLNERITAEDVLKRGDGSDVVLAAAPLIDLTPVQKLPEDKQLEFLLLLVLRLMQSDVQSNGTLVHVLSCKFIVKRVPWSRSLPWNRKK